MRGGIEVALMAFWALCDAELIVLGGSIGVELIDGRLKAAGSMSGILSMDVLLLGKSVARLSVGGSEARGDRSLRSHQMVCRQTNPAMLIL